MTDQEKKELCNKFFDELVTALNEEWKEQNLGSEWTIVKSCNQDFSRYLVRKGNENYITYYGKPEFSFRISDHWNWFSNTKKCEDPFYVQCNSSDMPYARFRPDSRATKPRYGVQVCMTIDGEVYRCVFGECFDRQSKTWSWKDNTPKSVASAIAARWMLELYG